MKTLHSQPAHPPQVVILGGGFGGLTTAKRLACSDACITLIDRQNHHLFQPLLYQVATASLAAPSIAAPLRHIVRKQRNVTVLLEEVSAIDLAAHQVQCGSTALTYDYLVIATGAVSSYFGHDDWAPFAPSLKTLDDALLIRRHVLRAFEHAERESDPTRQQDWLNFVVVGGGPTGVELAGTLIELARHTLSGEFRRCDPQLATVKLIEAGPRLLAGFDPLLSDKAQQQLEQLGVQVHTGAAVSRIDAEGINVGERRFPARTVLWAAGVAASPVGRMLGVPLDKSGRVKVDDDLSVSGHRNVFVIGDLARVEQADGSTVPGVAPAAKQMGKYVGDALRARLNDRDASPKPFRYQDEGSLAAIGRLSAVAQFGTLKLSGFVAWTTWLVAHIYFLIGFRNRLAVLLDWAWAYFAQQRQARIISGTDPDKPDQPARHD
ncbi:MAG: NAD(P)/FAD-dependent oxidoreductase [Rhodanobacter sp.]